MLPLLAWLFRVVTGANHRCWCLNQPYPPQSNSTHPTALNCEWRSPSIFSPSSPNSISRRPFTRLKYRSSLYYWQPLPSTCHREWSTTLSHPSRTPAPMLVSWHLRQVSGPVMAPTRLILGSTSPPWYSPGKARTHRSKCSWVLPFCLA
jgi:hypothetical protein